MHPIGIDLGTTYSAIAKWKQAVNFTGSDVYNITTEGTDSLPSKIYLEHDEDNGEINFIVGKQALQNTISNPENGVSAVKRDMDDVERKTYTIMQKTYSPIDMSAEILKALLKNVEAIEKPGGYVPTGVVVTVPYYFKQHQNLNTKNAVLKALNDLYNSRHGNTEELFLALVAEPIAAGLDFAFSRASEKFNDENFLVFDLGGGTFDVTIFSLTQNDKEVIFKVLAVGGHDRLGGEDFDESLGRWVWQQSGFDIDSQDEKNQKRILKKAVPLFTEAKVTLTAMKSANIIIPPVVAGMEPIDLDVKRKDFEGCLQAKNGNTERNFLGEIEREVDSALTKAGLKSKQINSVLLTGGSSRIPLFSDLIERKFGKDKIRHMEAVDLAVTRGAAVYAAYLLDKNLEKAGQPHQYLKLWDKIEIVEPTAHALGIPTSRSPFYLLIKDNAVTPASKTIPIQFSKLSEDGSKIILEDIDVLQGSPNDFSKVGVVKIDQELFTHGRKKEEIKGRLTLTAEHNLIRMKIEVPQANADKSDFILEQDLSLG